MRKNGTRSGYTEYRYGERRPITLAGAKTHPIFKGDQRRHVVGKVMDILRDWRFSPFELEASCVHGMRVALCLAGHDFGRAEAEAAGTVSEGLHLLRAKRPSWAEGQPEYTTPRENCLQCRGPLGDDQMAHGDRFCCGECAVIYLKRRDSRYQMRTDTAMHSAYRVAAVAQRPARICECCGKSFRKRGNAAKDEHGTFCSARCAATARRTMPEVACAHCGKAFRVGSADRIGTQRTCSRACYLAHRVAAPTVYRFDCALCHRPFEATAPTAKFCGETCKALEWRWRTGRVVPTRLRAVVFDYFIGRPAEALVARALTPPAFDQVFAMAA